MKFSVQQGGAAKVGAVQNHSNQKNQVKISRESVTTPAAKSFSAAKVSISAQQAIRSEKRDVIRNAEDASELAHSLTGTILSQEAKAIEAQGNLSAGKVLTLVESEFLQ